MLRTGALFFAAMQPNRLGSAMLDTNGLRSLASNRWMSASGVSVASSSLILIQARTVPEFDESPELRSADSAAPLDSARMLLCGAGNHA